MKRAILLLALGVPTSLAAQTTTVSTYVAADAGVTGGPTMVGLNVARTRGWMAVRVGAAMDAGPALFRSGAEPGAEQLRVLSGDLDALLYLGSPSADRSIHPYLLAGVGGRSLTGSSTTSALTWGYGVGGRSPLTSWLALEGEVRYREPVTAPGPESGHTSGFEYRLGMGVSLGAARPARPRVPAPMPLPRAAAAPLATRAAEAGSAAAARRAIAVRALDTADDFLGVKYTWGGNSPEEGFDCSGFVKFVFATAGVALPRVSRDQARAGAPVPLDVAAFEPGDLIAFAPSPGSTVDHIAIYAGNGQIIHSSSSGRGVRFDDLFSERGRWYREHMVAVRRVIDAPMFFGAE